MSKLILASLILIQGVPAFAKPRTKVQATPAATTQNQASEADAAAAATNPAYTQGRWDGTTSPAQQAADDKKAEADQQRKMQNAQFLQDAISKLATPSAGAAPGATNGIGQANFNNATTPSTSNFAPASSALCTPGVSASSCWASATSVAQEGIIKPGSGYSVKAAGWPKISSLGGGRVQVSYPNGASHCNSATATAFYKHIADLVNAGKLTLTESQMNYLNGDQVQELLDGNTYSFALLNEFLGGKNMKGTDSSEIAAALREAKAGDVFKFDRSNGTGHSTIFKEVRGDQFCYWTSNANTNGVGERCEPISGLAGVSVSRFPTDIASIPARIDNMRQSPKLQSVLSKTKNGTVQPGQVAWANALPCDSNSPSSGSPARGVASDGANSAS